MPTFKRLKEKHPSATMMWFQNGKLWPSRIDAQEAMRARGEMGRRGDERQGAELSKAGSRFHSRRSRSQARTRDRSPSRRETRVETQRPHFTSTAPKRSRHASPKPTESANSIGNRRAKFTPAPKRSEKPEWKPKACDDSRRSEKPDWKPKGSFDRERKTRLETEGLLRSRSQARLETKGLFDRERKPTAKSEAAETQRPRDEHDLRNPNGNQRVVRAESEARLEAKDPSRQPRVPGEAQVGPQGGIQEVHGHRSEARQQVAPRRRASRSASEVQGREEGEVDEIQEDDSNEVGDEAKKKRDDLSRRPLPSAPDAHA